MVTKEIVKEAADKGLPALKVLFEKLPPKEILTALGMLVIAGVGAITIDAIRDLVKDKV